MRRVVHKTLAARFDLLEIADYLEQAANLRTALRFLAAAEKTFASLARLPGLGGGWESPDPRLQGMRVWPVRKFRKYLVFYRPLKSGVEIVRIIHGARDVEKALARDLD